MNEVLGKLYLIPTTLGDNAPLEVLPISIKKIIEQIDTFIVENEKTARRFIKSINPKENKVHNRLHPESKAFELLKIRIKDMGITQKTLAKHLDTSRQSISMALNRNGNLNLWKRIETFINSKDIKD